MLKAEGYSYAEIEEITGFSQTKINRCMVEGRRRFLETFAEIEEGRRCEALSPALSRFCDGELDTESRARLMEHLGQCAHCRAKLRAYRETPRRVLALAPAGIAAGPTLADRFGERLALIGDRVRETAASLAHRGSGALDASQTIAAGGGARGSGLAAVALICGVGAAGGGAAICVEKGVLPDPLGGARQEREAESPPASAPIEPPPPAAVQPDAAVEKPEPPQPATPAQVRAREFEPQPSSGTSEFGAAAGSGGGRSGSGAAGSQFGFEK